MNSHDNKTSSKRDGTASKGQTLMVEGAAKMTEETTKPADGAESAKEALKGRFSKKHAGKHKKSKKHTETSASSSESEDDDDVHIASSSAGQGSETEPEKLKKKKSGSRKRRDPPKRKAKIHTKGQSKVAKRQRSVSSSDSDSSSTNTAAKSDDEDVEISQQALLQQIISQQALLQQGLAKLQLAQQPHQHSNNPYHFDGNYQNTQQKSVDDRAGADWVSITTAAYPQSSLFTQLNSSRNRCENNRTPNRGLRRSSELDLSNLLATNQLQKDKSKKPKATRLDFKRVDQVWDNTIHNYKLQDTADGTDDTQYDEFIFHVRRTFDWEGKYRATLVDIKSNSLRECLQDVIGNIKGISLVEDTPKLDPNLLFLYLEDLRKHLKVLKKSMPSLKSNRHDRKKEQKAIDTKPQHLKVLIRYLDEDYDDVKNSLYPMLENGLITFDLLWALWKPNTLAFTTTYGSPDEPRVFKVEMAERHRSILKGDFYHIEGKYLEYDGKQFGFGSMGDEIGEFRGARRITSLKCYPIQYHKNEAQLRNDLIERGKKFVALGGVHYKSHQGMAYCKKKKAVIKVNINGRIMIDPSVHRRINPNYPVSVVRPKDYDIISDEDSDGNSESCACDSDSDGREGGLSADGGKVKYISKLTKDRKGKVQIVRVPKVSANDDDATKEKLDQVSSNNERDYGVDGDNEESAPEANPREDKDLPDFTDEEYLIASPVVLGFAFAEKLWLEFTISGVREIQWNEGAYESLVLETKTKDIVKALVESHKYHAAESIDDVIQGKGKGLVAVLHGPPGTGKTLTAEGISELLKCPLYMVSAGELGTDSRYLETELQKILDICHAWGAILLLDEADVFLEKRNMHDLHRNALVSIFLRQLEYFQGILFLTTNRVETFDDAFQSRIHIALRYDSLDQKAKRAIFKIFIERVRVLEKADLMPFTDEDLNALARHELNGRQIKNTIRTAQALAVNRGEPLSMSHIRQVLDVQINFERDLKGGPGYHDAMRSYF